MPRFLRAFHSQRLGLLWVDSKRKGGSAPRSGKKKVEGEMVTAQLASCVCLSHARHRASAVAGQEQPRATSLSNETKDVRLGQRARCIQAALERLTSPPAVDNAIAETVAAA